MTTPFNVNYIHRMPEHSPNRLSAVLLGAMRPLIRALLRYGMTYSEFAEICKAAFVEAATQDYGIRSRPTNISRVAVMTGLSRKEVSRIRSGFHAQLAFLAPKRNTAADVLNSWYTNPSYLDEASQPAPLPFSGLNASFVELVREVTRDIPPGAMKVELVRAGAIVENSDGCLRPVRRHFVPSDINSRLAEGINLGLRTLAGTIAFNSDATSNETLRFQRVVQIGGIPCDRSAAVRERLNEMLTVVSLEIDDYLSATAAEGQLDATQSLRIGVGMHYFEEVDDGS